MADSGVDAMQVELKLLFSKWEESCSRTNRSGAGGLARRSTALHPHLISATDWADRALPAATAGPSWDLEQLILLARELKEKGLVDLLDPSSGGMLPSIDWAGVLQPCYQAPFAGKIRAEAGIATGAVGPITTGAEANAIIESGQADIVLIGRELLRNPMWPLMAAAELGLDKHKEWIPQYRRGAPVVKAPAAGAAPAAAGPR